MNISDIIQSVTLTQNPKIRLASVGTDGNHPKVLQLLQHFSLILICDASQPHIHHPMKGSRVSLVTLCVRLLSLMRV